MKKILTTTVNCLLKCRHNCFLINIADRFAFVDNQHALGGCTIFFNVTKVFTRFIDYNFQTAFILFLQGFHESDIYLASCTGTDILYTWFLHFFSSLFYARTFYLLMYVKTHTLKHTNDNKSRQKKKQLSKLTIKLRKKLKNPINLSIILPNNLQ